MPLPTEIIHAATAFVVKEAATAIERLAIAGLVGPIIGGLGGGAIAYGGSQDVADPKQRRKIVLRGAARGAVIGAASGLTGEKIRQAEPYIVRKLTGPAPAYLRDQILRRGRSIERAVYLGGGATAKGMQIAGHGYVAHKTRDDVQKAKAKANSR